MGILPRFPLAESMKDHEAGTTRRTRNDSKPTTPWNPPAFVEHDIVQSATMLMELRHVIERSKYFIDADMALKASATMSRGCDAVYSSVFLSSL